MIGIHGNLVVTNADLVVCWWYSGGNLVVSSGGTFWWFAGGLWWQTGGEQVEARAGGAAHGGGGLLRHLKAHPDIITCILSYRHTLPLVSYQPIQLFLYLVQIPSCIPFQQHLYVQGGLLKIHFCIIICILRGYDCAIFKLFFAPS